MKRGKRTALRQPSILEDKWNIEKEEE